MRLNGIEITLLIKGRPITEFPHNGQVFVEGREGSDYEVEVRNDNPFRVEAIVSVDGLSVMDGKPAGSTSGGYVIEARSKLAIPGWRLNGAEVARFQFGGKKESYTAQVTGSTANTGVIGVLAYRENVPPQRVATVGMAFPGGINNSGHGLLSGHLLSHGGWVGAGMPDRMMSSGVRGFATNTVMSHQSEGVYSKGVASAAASTEPVQQTLGTAFGEAATFRTETVEFRRGDMEAMLVLYYDDARGLRARGIELVRPSRQRREHRPEAFPAMTEGCAPPKGWRR